MAIAATTPLQRSFDDLGVPLSEITFCVIDLETTGTRPSDDRITEIAAAKFRCGEQVDTFQTLINPQCPIPAAITLLTAITEEMIADTPVIDEVLSPLLEFLDNTVIVGHNVRFDLGFINAALQRFDHAPITNMTLDTLGLARRLVRDEVPNLKLQSLARSLNLDHQPSHRALDDVLATADLLHKLIDRASGLGVTGLDDLLSLPKITGHPQAAKLAMTANLPRKPGIYMFKNRVGDVLYVGKATNLRSRVRSYFSTDARKKVGTLLRETQQIDHMVCKHPLEAAVVEIRLIHQHRPQYNHQLKQWSRYVYIKLPKVGASPRPSIVRAAEPDGFGYLGPLPSVSFAKRIIAAVDTVFPDPSITPKPTTSADDEVGVKIIKSLTSEPWLLFDPLWKQMTNLAKNQCYEDAELVRERAATLETAMRRQRQIDGLRNTGRLVFELSEQGGAELNAGIMTRAWDAHGKGQSSTLIAPVAKETPPYGPIPCEQLDELLCIAQWIEANATSLQIIHSDNGYATELPRIDRFERR